MRGSQKSLTPRFSFFPSFQGVHMAAMTSQLTTFLPLSLFSGGAHGCDEATGHLAFPFSPLFSGAPVATTNRLASSLAGLFLRSWECPIFLKKKETLRAELFEDKVRKKKKPDCTAIDAFSFLNLIKFSARSVCFPSSIENPAFSFAGIRPRQARC